MHSLEHGAVWITYDPQLPEDRVTALRDEFDGEYLLVSPHVELDGTGEVVASAWGVQLRATSVDDEGLDDFVSAYREGPQTPELGAACSGGVGTPA